MTERNELGVRRYAWKLSEKSLEKKQSEQGASSKPRKGAVRQLERTVNVLKEGIII